MKQVDCSYFGCSNRRAHYEKPDQTRDHVLMWVPDDAPGPWYCSIECMTYDRYYRDNPIGSSDQIPDKGTTGGPGEP